MSSVRNTPLFRIKKLIKSMESSVDSMWEYPPDQERMLPQEFEAVNRELNRDFRLSVQHVYGRRTVAENNYWGSDFSYFFDIVKMSQNTYGTIRDYEELLEKVKTLEPLVKERDRRFKDQETIERKTFTHRGFKVEAKDLSEVVIEAMLEPLDVLDHLFKKRKVTVLLHESLSKVVLRSNPEDEIEGGWGISDAVYVQGKKIICLYDTLLDRTCHISGLKRIVFTFVHEIGHWLHLDFLSEDARDYWNKSWEGVIPKGMDYLTYEQASKNETLKSLGIPTPYGHRDPYEDFAETFAHFILKPEMLSERALERMKETLRMSYRAGRSFMRLAHHSPDLFMDD